MARASGVVVFQCVFAMLWATSGQGEWGVAFHCVFATILMHCLQSLGGEGATVGQGEASGVAFHGVFAIIFKICDRFKRGGGNRWPGRVGL